jgi:hypothetical protein
MYTIAVCVTCTVLVIAIGGVVFAITATFVAASYGVKSAWSALRTISQAWLSAMASQAELSPSLPPRGASSARPWLGTTGVGTTS